MNVFGRTSVGSKVYELASDEKRVAAAVMPADAMLAKVSIYLDGQGRGAPFAASQACRAVIYDPAEENDPLDFGGGALVAVSNEVVILSGQAPGWVDFTFPVKAGAPVNFAPATFYVGLIGGGPGSYLIRWYGDDPHGDGGWDGFDTYEDGASDPFGDVFDGSKMVINPGASINDTTRTTAATWTTTTSSGTRFCDEFAAGAGAGSGIWHQTTNLFRRGQCDALTDWIDQATGQTTSLDATTKPPFSSQSVKSICNGTTGSQGVGGQTATAQAAAAGTLVAALMWFKGTAARTYTVKLTITNTDATTTVVSSTFTGTGGWQVVRAPINTVAVGKTGDKFTVAIVDTATFSQTMWFAHAHIEKGTHAATGPTPYKLTKGGTTGSVTEGWPEFETVRPYLSSLQGWVAMRWRWGWPSTAVRSYAVAMFDWADGQGNEISVVLDTSNRWVVTRKSASGQDVYTSAAQTFNRDDPVTLVAKWDGGTIGLSINGAAFATAASTHVVDMPQPDVDGFATSQQAFGNGAFSSECIDSRIMWFTGGKGAVQNADATTLNGYGDSPPDITTLVVALPSSDVRFAFLGQDFFNIEALGASMQADMSAFVTFFAPYSTIRPLNETDLYYSRLPFTESQAVFSAGSPVQGSQQLTEAGWHSTFIDPEMGANALVRKGSALESLLGERIVVSTVGTVNPKKVYVYVHDLAGEDELDWDLSLTRHVYARLGALADETTQVTVEVVG